MIRKAGDWTGDVHAMFKTHPIDNSADISPADLPDARVDGPFGTASEEVFQHPIAVLVGAGIGATPAASILRHIRDRMKNVTGCSAQNCGCSCYCCQFKLQKLYFVWSNRDTGAFEVRLGAGGRTMDEWANVGRFSRSGLRTCSRSCRRRRRRKPRTPTRRTGICSTSACI